MDHRDPGNAGYAGALMSIVTGDMVLLGLFLPCGSSASVRIGRGGGIDTWAVGILEAPNVQGH